MRVRRIREAHELKQPSRQGSEHITLLPTVLDVNTR
jgi:hypothetical protein